MTHQLLITSPVVTAQLRNDMPEFKTGSEVEVHYKIIEGGKERVQIFRGIVIARQHGETIAGSFTVLKNSGMNTKIERVFPFNSPLIDHIKVIGGLKRAKRSKLYNLRTVKDPEKQVRSKTVKPKTVSKIAKTKVTITEE